MQAADLSVACVELQPYKALVDRMRRLYKHSKEDMALGLDERGFGRRLGGAAEPATDAAGRGGGVGGEACKSGRRFVAVRC